MYRFFMTVIIAASFATYAYSQNNGYIYHDCALANLDGPVKSFEQKTFYKNQNQYIGGGPSTYEPNGESTMGRYVQETYGNKIKRNSKGYIITNTSKDGIVTSYEYTPDNKISRIVTGPDQRKIVKYLYNSNGILTEKYTFSKRANGKHDIDEYIEYKDVKVDPYGNWIKCTLTKTVYGPLGFKSTDDVIRNIEYYNVQSSGSTTPSTVPAESGWNKTDKQKPQSNSSTNSPSASKPSTSSSSSKPITPAKKPEISGLKGKLIDPHNLELTYNIKDNNPNVRHEVYIYDLDKCDFVKDSGGHDRVFKSTRGRDGVTAESIFVYSGDLPAGSLQRPFSFNVVIKLIDSTTGNVLDQSYAVSFEWDGDWIMRVYDNVEDACHHILAVRDYKRLFKLTYDDIYKLKRETPIAYLYMGACLQYGVGSSEKDMYKAMAHYKKGASLGSRECQEWINLLNSTTSPSLDTFISRYAWKKNR